MQNLIESLNAKDLYQKKKSIYIEKRIPLSEQSKYLSQGYLLKKAYKNEAIVLKTKKFHVLFEDSIWCLFYEMGFNHLNKDSFLLPYDKQNNTTLTKQIDVFAMDDETILLVECKAAEFQKPGNFKENLESYNGMRAGLISHLREIYPKKKIAIIYATSNYDLGEKDLSRLASFQIHHFDEKKVKYFSDLANHLGPSSKYQLLGVLFPKTKIEGLETNVMAIKGQMGSKTYYSFSIEPEKLLKLAFILHRSNSLHTQEMMPTYQRIIKKKRLKEVREYVDNGGYFPNSIIISVDTTNHDLKFDLFGKGESESHVKSGILHLPQTYRSCYVIDGQHRLYGYSESSRANKDVIPVIAFINLAKEEQVKMFMDINENQKSVSKTLRNTLDIDLLWDSKNKKESTKALILSIIQSLGEKSKNSPFFDRIILGENTKSSVCNLTLENVRLALTRTNFFNEYDKNNRLTKQGYFQHDDNLTTENVVLKVINYFFSEILSDNKLHDTWDKGDDDWLSTNNMVAALLSLLDDYLDIAHRKFPLPLPFNFDLIQTTIKDLSFFIQVILPNLTEEDKKFIRSQKGGSAPIDVKKYLGYKLNLENPNFAPDWLSTYKDNFQQKNSGEANEKLTEFLKFLRYDINSSLINEFGENWSLMELDPKTMESIIILNGKFEAFNPGTKLNHKLETSSFKELYEIITYKNYWSKIFKTKYQDEEKLLGSNNPIEKFSLLYNKTEKKENLSKYDFENLVKLIDSLYERNKK